MHGCLHDSLLADLADGTIDASERQRVAEHIEACSECLVVAAATAARAPAAKPDPSLTPIANGAVLEERFEIVQQLGAGGMGEVHLAFDRALQTNVAVKVLAQALMANIDARARIHREIVLARRITHPNVCRLYDMGTTGDRVFLTMELLGGRDLAHWMRLGRLPAANAWQVTGQILAALDAIHSGGVIHRDLKPGNVMLGYDGRAVVLDFGLAADARRDGQSAHMIGTPRYWAPEQLDGAAASALTDIYAVGLIARELFAEFGSPDDVRRVDPFTQRCLAINPGARFQSARDALLELQRAAREPRRASVTARARIGRRMAIAACVAGWLSVGGVAVASSQPTTTGLSTLGSVDLHVERRPRAAGEQSWIRPIRPQPARLADASEQPRPPRRKARRRRARRASGASSPQAAKRRLWFIDDQ